MGTTFVRRAQTSDHLGDETIKVSHFITRKILILSCIGCMLQLDLLAKEFPRDLDQTSNIVRVSIIPEVKTVGSTKTFWVAVKQVIEPGWHTYWRNAGDVGAPITINWSLPEGFEASKIHWPYPERIAYGDFTNFGYHDEVILLTEITPPKALEVGQIEIKANVKWLVCKDVCIPEQANLAVQLSVSTQEILDEQHKQMFKEARLKLPKQMSVESHSKVGQENLSISVDLPGLGMNRVTNVSYFPFSAGVINNSASQSFFVNESGIFLELLLDEKVDKTTSSFNGIIVIDEDVGGALRSSFFIEPIHSDNIGIGVSFLGALAFAFLGGLILNLMPCVFPVLSIKILSLMELARGESLKIHALVYFLGVVFSFLSVAGVLLIFRAAGAEVGWGFQLQSPIVIGSLAYLFVLLGLNLSGYFELRFGWLGGGFINIPRSGYAATFFTGVLATVVAAPCTAPFMGVALGYAITQSNTIALVVFGSLGAGMATPYCLISVLPGLLERLPKPGIWMETLRQFLAFPLYATAIWLIWILSIQTSSDSILYILGGLLTLIFSIWVAKKYTNSFARNVIVGLLVVAALALLTSLPTLSREAIMKEDINVIPYSEEALQKALNQGPVFINFTAAWCITCKVNELAVIKTKRIRKALADNGVQYMEGDWTAEDPEITKALESFSRTGVPLYLLYSKEGRKTRVLPQILTENIVLEAIDDL